MKPNPLSGLNHFTVPVATSNPSFRGLHEPGCCSLGLPAWCREGTARSQNYETEPSTTSIRTTWPIDQVGSLSVSVVERTRWSGLTSRPTLAAVLGAGCIAFSGILVRLADVSPDTAAVFRC